MVWIFIVVVLGLIYFYFKQNYTFFDKLGIPGPSPIPIYGNTWGSWKKRDHLTAAANVEKYGRTFGIYRGLTPVLMTVEPELMKNILVRDSAIFLSRQQVVPFNASIKDFADLTGEQLKKFREFTVSALTLKNIKDMSIGICDVSLNLCKMLKGNDSCKVDAMLISKMFVMDMLTQSLLGINIGTIGNPSHPFLTRNFKVTEGPLVNLCYLYEFLSKLSITAVCTFSKKYKDEKKLWDALIEGRLDVIKTGHGNDYITKLSAHIEKYKRTDHAFGDPKLFKVIAGLMSAETTYDVSAFVMGAAIHCLALHPEFQEKARNSVRKALKEHGGWSYDAVQDMEYLEQCIFEAMRLYPSGFGITRLCSRDTSYNGITIMKGTTVEIPIYAVHRNQDFYDNPEEYNPYRFSKDEKNERDSMLFQSFGHGPRSCLGMKFATAALKIGIGRLLINFHFKQIFDTKIPLHYEIRQNGLATCSEAWIGVEHLQK